jgi:hypothetical protein
MLLWNPSIVAMHGSQIYPGLAGEKTTPINHGQVLGFLVSFKSKNKCNMVSLHSYSPKDSSFLNLQVF